MGEIDRIAEQVPEEPDAPMDDYGRSGSMKVGDLIALLQTVDGDREVIVAPAVAANNWTHYPVRSLGQDGEGRVVIGLEDETVTAEEPEIIGLGRPNREAQEAERRAEQLEHERDQRQDR